MINVIECDNCAEREARILELEAEVESAERHIEELSERMASLLVRATACPDSTQGHQCTIRPDRHYEDHTGHIFHEDDEGPEHVRWYRDRPEAVWADGGPWSGDDNDARPSIPSGPRDWGDEPDPDSDFRKADREFGGIDLPDSPL